MSPRQHGALGALIVLMVGVGAFFAPAPAGAVAASGAATAGVCKDASGVSVVVDMSALGGDVIVRCVNGSGFSGLEALKKAGFSVTGTQQSGAAYVCRIQGRPSATETLAVNGKPGYKEACVVTPPTSAYWGYWYATNGGGWKYSNAGAASHPVIKGGFEGWAFSLNHAGSPPKPAVTPTRPKAPAPPPSTPTTEQTQPAPTGGGGDGGASSGSGGPNSGPSGNGGSSSQAPTGALDAEPGEGSKSASGDKGKGDNAKGDKGDDAEAPDPTSATDDPTTTSTDDVRVTGELPEDPSAGDDPSSSSSAVPTLIGVGLLVALGGGAGYTAWRRSHRG